MKNYDVHTELLDPDEQRSTGKYFGFGYKAAVAVRGPQKMINRWLKCLMTPKGTDAHDRNYGTGFTNLIGANVGNEIEAMEAVALFIDDCNQQIKAFDTANMPPAEERLESATLAQFVELPEGDGFQVYVYIRNVAGLVLPLELPTIARR